MIANIRQNWIIYALLVLLTVAVYSRVTQFGFVQYDDGVYVTDNDHVKSGLSFENLRYALTFTQDANWIPLTWASLMIDHRFSETSGGHEIASVYHRTNLILHVLNTLLLFAVLTALTGCRWRSAMVAAIFAVHPLHVESVAWVSERKDVLSTMFMMLAMLAYVRYCRKPSARRYAVILLLFAAGLMSKSMLVTLPIVLLLMDWWPLRRVEGSTLDKKTRGRSWRQLVIEKLPMLGLSLTVSLVTFLAQCRGGAVGTLEDYPIGVRLANALVSYFGYLKHMVWPVNLTSLYMHPGRSLPVALVIFCGLMLAALTYAAVRVARTMPHFTVGWLWYVITLIPVIGIVQVGQQAMADRYTYITLIGVFVAVVWSVCDLTKSVRGRDIILGALAAAVLIPLCLQAYSQTLCWRDNITFFTHAMRNAPDNRLVRHNFALAEKDVANDLFERGQVDEAISHYRDALKVDPQGAMLHAKTVAQIHNSLGIAYGTKGDISLAREQFLEALRVDKESTDAMCNLVKIALDSGNVGEGLRYAKQAYSIAPSDPKVCQAMQVAEAMSRRGAR